LLVVRALAVIGPLSRDVVAGRAERIGGGPWYAGRALRALQQEAVVVAKCGEPERRSYLRRLAALGLPVALASGGETTSFSFRYDAEGHREMRVEAIGDPWCEGDEPARALRRVEWVHVAPVLRGDFPPETLERIAHRRRLLLDAHGLVRTRRVGPLVLDADFDRTLLRHVSILKLSEEEARAILGDGELEKLRELGVPEVVVTFGAGGSLILTRDSAVRVAARPARGDPTGAGDAFSVAYLSARAGGHRPISAARRASALVSALLSNTVLLGRTGP
jgi:sugar/nucleoside kinase (ribokinase family)